MTGRGSLAAVDAFLDHLERCAQYLQGTQGVPCRITFISLASPQGEDLHNIVSVVKLTNSRYVRKHYMTAILILRAHRLLFHPLYLTTEGSSLSQVVLRVCLHVCPEPGDARGHARVCL